MKTRHLIVNGDCRDMGELPDQSVHLIVTSPPCWQLKDYGAEGQIGFHDTYEDYINYLNVVWKECYRVLHDGCRLCINVADQFARSVYYGRYKIIPIHAEVIRFCEAIGFDFMGPIIWQKATTLHTTGGAPVMGSYPYPRNGMVKLDFEYILIFKKQGAAPVPTSEQKAHSVLTNEEWNCFFNGHWNFSGAKQKGMLSAFPEVLPHRLIKMFSYVGDTVLDPFLGSGTTSLAARKLHRHSVGYEINEGFIDAIRERIGTDNLLESVELEVIKRNAMSQSEIAAKLKDLPYLFFDVHHIDKKLDVKKLQYGSAFDVYSPKTRTDSYVVKEILSPELVLLENELTVRLIGVKAKPQATDKAMNYLRRKLVGQEVSMQYDQVKYDEYDHLMVYMYLSDRTFVNVRLIQYNLVSVDMDAEFRFKNKFLAVSDILY